MKHSTLHSTKFLKLKLRLKAKTFEVIGILEGLWILTATNTPDGGIGRRSNEDIAAFLDWDRDPDFLVEQLVATGWIDLDPDSRLVIHDWYDHCSQWVKGMLASPATKKGYKAKTAKTPSATLSEPLSAALSETPEEAQSEALGAAPPNLTQPNLTQPNQTKPNQIHLAPSPNSSDSEPKPVSLPFQTNKSKSKTDPTNLGEVVLTFPVSGDDESPTWELRQGFVDEFQADFPGIDVVEQFRAALRWVKNNPPKRKTARGMRKFLHGWIERSVNEGRRAPSKAGVNMDTALELAFRNKGD